MAAVIPLPGNSIFRHLIEGTEAMKSRILVFSFFVIVYSLTPAADGFCAQPTTVRNITAPSSISDNSFPMLSGMALVWQGKGGLAGTSSGGNDWEIFLYDLVNETVIQLTDDDSDDLSPRTDGDFVVWQKHAGGGNQIFLYRIQDGSPVGGSRISEDGKDNYSPRIAAGRIVWTAQAITHVFEPGRIMLYDATDGSAPVAISNPAVDCSSPRIDPQQVIWTQHAADKTESLYVYNLMSDPPKGAPAPEGFVWNKSTTVDHNRQVLTRNDGTDKEIVLHNKTEGYVRITDNTLTDTSPTISRNLIAWAADGDIYLTDITKFMHVQVPDHFNVRGTAFYASWAELTDKVDAYYLDVSTDPEFGSFVDGYRDLNVGTDNLFRVEGLTPDRTYYYRVYASVNGSTTTQSKSVTVKLTTSAPLPERNCTALQFVYRLLLK